MRGCARALGRASSFQIGRYDHLEYKAAVWLNAEGLLLFGGGGLMGVWKALLHIMVVSMGLGRFSGYACVI